MTELTLAQDDMQPTQCHNYSEADTVIHLCEVSKYSCLLKT